MVIDKKKKKNRVGALVRVKFDRDRSHIETVGDNGVKQHEPRVVCAWAVDTPEKR